jgi:hypothetical protein
LWELRRKSANACASAIHACCVELITTRRHIMRTLYPHSTGAHAPPWRGVPVVRGRCARLDGVPAVMTRCGRRTWTPRRGSPSLPHNDRLEHGRDIFNRTMQRSCRPIGLSPRGREHRLCVQFTRAVGTSHAQIVRHWLNDSLPLAPLLRPSRRGRNVPASSWPESTLACERVRTRSIGAEAPRGGCVLCLLRCRSCLGATTLRIHRC